MDVSLIWLAFVLGLSSTVHCWGMCGGLLIAFSSPGPGTTFMRALAFNLVRTSSYILAGAMVGMLGGVAVSGGSPGMAHAWLQAGASPSREGGGAAGSL
jgi:sulfite exporter TauE/SafE